MQSKRLRHIRYRRTSVFILLIAFISLSCDQGSKRYGEDASISIVDASDASRDERNWIGVWGGSRNPIDSLFAPEIADQSIRVIVNPTLGGETIRIRLSNTFGRYPLKIGSVRVGMSKVTEGENGDLGDFTPELYSDSNTQLTFAGLSQIEIPPYSDALSDPIRFPFDFGDNLAISVAIRGPADLPTFTRCCLGAWSTPQGGGDQTADQRGDAFTTDITWQLGGGRGCPFLNAIDVLDRDAMGTVVAIGNSITEGAGSPEDGPFDRWPWLLARRINDAGMRIGILNMGVAGNTVTLPPKTGNETNLVFLLETGPERFDRDVLQQTNLRSVIIALGSNDLRLVEPNIEAIKAGIQQMVDRSHEAEAKVLLATIPPSTMLDLNVSHNDDRRAINDWIRNHQGIEGWLPFDETLRDPEDVDSLQKQYDLDGDNIHPEDAGRRALADSIRLDLL
jgi:lysophospholipase L1-like esterase